jgi:hypothetical protein
VEVSFIGEGNQGIWRKSQICCNKNLDIKFSVHEAFLVLIFRGRLIQELVHLRQLDEVEISAKEKREVGLEASSDEDEEEEEELDFKIEKKPQEGNLYLI